jgi:uncharacterized protein YciI
MLYMILGIDVPGSLAARKAARPPHLARLTELQRLGRLVLAGPCPAIDAPDIAGGVAGSLIVAEFGSLAEAEDWAAQDPYRLEGVYASVTVRPFLKTLPA